MRALVTIYENPRDHRDLYLLAEAMLDYDELFVAWRQRHVQMAERMIDADSMCLRDLRRLPSIGPARALAIVRGRDFVTPDDIREMTGPALGHRMILRSELWVRGVEPRVVLTAIVESVDAPSWQ